MEMRIERVVLRQLAMKMKSPFTTSFGTQLMREFIVVEVVDEDGTVGWGESVALLNPWYNEETMKTNWHMLEDFIIPALLGVHLEHPDEVTERLQFIRKNNMAKSAFEGAVWDIFAKQQGQYLGQTLGGTKSEISVGISIGIQKDASMLIRMIGEYLETGYKRIKLKIKPGQDVEVVRGVRQVFPDVPLMVDANSSYQLRDLDHLRRLDEFNLMMIEQPLSHDDLVDHAKIQARLETPICLDESIHSAEDARKAIELGSCRIINLKIGRVGGLSESLRIHDVCREAGIPLWCGGMLESGIGRAHNIAVTTLANFTLPGDTAASSRYWDQDIIEPEVKLTDGVIQVPTNSGIGFTVDGSTLDRYTVASKSFSASSL